MSVGAGWPYLWVLAYRISTSSVEDINALIEPLEDCVIASESCKDTSTLTNRETTEYHLSVPTSTIDRSSQHCYSLAFIAGLILLNA